jgi:hypothetical protein
MVCIIKPSSPSGRVGELTLYVGLWGRFQFVSINNPEQKNDSRDRRRARSHAVKQGIERKRKLQQQSMSHFQVLSTGDFARNPGTKKTRSQLQVSLPYTPSAGALDPFETLAVPSSRLQALLGNSKAILLELRHIGTL